MASARLISRATHYRLLSNHCPADVVLNPRESITFAAIFWHRHASTSNCLCSSSDAWTVWRRRIYLQRRNHVFQVEGVQFLGLGYYYPFTEKKIKQVYPVWCSQLGLHNHTLFIKKLCNKLGVRPNFGEVRATLPEPPVVASMSLSDYIQRIAYTDHGHLDTAII